MTHLLSEAESHVRVLLEVFTTIRQLTVAGPSCDDSSLVMCGDTKAFRPYINAITGNNTPRRDTPITNS